MATLLKNSISPLTGKQAFIVSEDTPNHKAPAIKLADINLDTDIDIQLIDKEILSAPLITINSQNFNDGRIFSLSSAIRQQLNYQGDLRVSGEVLLDQLNQLKRCGVSSFLVNEDNPDQIASAILALNHNPACRFR